MKKNTGLDHYRCHALRKDLTRCNGIRIKKEKFCAIHYKKGAMHGIYRKETEDDIDNEDGICCNDNTKKFTISCDNVCYLLCFACDSCVCIYHNLDYRNAKAISKFPIKLYSLFCYTLQFFSMS